MSIRGNDYTGTQDIAMPIACEHRPPNPGLETETRDDQYHDISDMNNASHKNISDPSNYIKLNNKNNNVGDQRSHNDISSSHSTVNNYVVLDPNETGFNRSEGPDNMNESYELAQPIHHIDHSKDTEWERKTLDDVYAHSEEGVYDSSNGNRHKESESNVYSHAVDNVYDSSNHTRTSGETEDSYDHFTGKKTDDDYDISTI
ncbi:myb-like protein F [Mytilus trossulus]|uniref:myb-like protein F n=1 Tax=Mytilus trossulus TaxID=6551 RepID=UPI003003BDDE